MKWVGLSGCGCQGVVCFVSVFYYCKICFELFYCVCIPHPLQNKMLHLKWVFLKIKIKDVTHISLMSYI